MASTRARGLLLSAACLAGLCLGCAQGDGRSASPAADAGAELPRPGDSNEAVTPHMPGDPATETNVAGIRPDAGPDSGPDADAGPDSGPDAGPDPTR